MNRFLISIFAILIAGQLFAQKTKTDTHVIGHVVCNNEHIPFASVTIKGTTIGTLTDETGHFQLVHVPAGELTVVASSVGYVSKEIQVKTTLGKTTEIKFELLADVLNLSEVVVSADRNEQKRSEAAVIVNTISPQLFKTSQSVTLSDGLNFCTGLRMENNCQNCGFNQVRMNGMEGPYSQILINSRPIFSGLAGVYGLEMIPSNMIERVEVVRGGASALYGSNAIAGTINLILKDPVINTYEVGVSGGLTGVGMEGAEASADYSVNFNTSIVSDDRKTGMAVYGFTRERGMFDANGDGYSEIAPMENTTIGSRFFHRFGHRSKLAVDFFNIKESRAGGNKHEYPLHERDVAEAVDHDIKSGAITYDRFFRDFDLLSVYASGQYLKRDSYYGANKSLADYGATNDLTYSLGAQYKFELGTSSVVAGFEHTVGHLVDEKLGYPDYANAVIEDGKIVEIPHTDNTTVADQSAQTTGAFLQYDLKFNQFKLSLGSRFDHYKIIDHAKAGEEKSGNVFSPRVGLMYNLNDMLQARVSYSQGYRAPQIFDEDLHIETSGSRQVINENDPNLKQESSQSYSASLDFNQMIGSVSTSFLVEGFYTQLDNPFVNEIGTPDSTGTVIYTRKNAEGGATVMGVNMELKLRPSGDFTFTGGFTVQKSEYADAQKFDEKRFFRTPNNYGFVALDWDFLPRFCLSTSGTYTGKMLVPYFGPNTDPDMGELRESDPFFDLGTKLSYTTQLNGASVEFSIGAKNLFNSYQNDFDRGIDRDPSYMYGPTSPRAVYFGIRLGNLL